MRKIFEKGRCLLCRRRRRKSLTYVIKMFGNEVKGTAF
jgi:hypothetical protein